MAGARSASRVEARERFGGGRCPLHVLTLRAVPALAELVRVITPRDRRAAHVAWETRAFVDPHALRRVQCETSATLAAAAIEAHQLSRLHHQSSDGDVVELGDL